MKTIIETIDIEPTWMKIVNLWSNLDNKINDEHVLPELRKMAKLCDKVRQAQKLGETSIKI